MYYELPKRDKKIARSCIDKGLEAEFREGLEKCDAILRRWRDGTFASQKEVYHELFNAISTKDKAIARRYDQLSGSRWLITVIYLLYEGYISEDDIKDFSDETKVTVARQLLLLRKQ
jgi:hypothetical protein